MLNCILNFLLLGVYAFFKRSFFSYENEFSNISYIFAALGLEPDFLYPLENVTIAQGRDATFTCVVNNLGGYRVSGDSATARVCIKPTQYSYQIDEHFH